MAKWFFKKDGTQYGPFSAEQLRELARSGKLLPTDLVWREDMSEAVAASKVRGLFLDERHG